MKPCLVLLLTFALLSLAAFIPSTFAEDTVGMSPSGYPTPVRDGFFGPCREYPTPARAFLFGVHPSPPAPPMYPVPQPVPYLVPQPVPYLIPIPAPRNPVVYIPYQLRYR